MLIEKRSVSNPVNRAGPGWTPLSPFRGLANRNPLPVDILAQSGIQFGQSAQLEVRHALLVLLDLRRIADIAGHVWRHVEG